MGWSSTRKLWRWVSIGVAGLVAAVLLTGGIAFYRNSQQPLYAGEPADYWIRMLHGTNHNERWMARNSLQTAFHSLQHTNVAVPFVIRAITAGESPISAALANNVVLRSRQIEPGRQRILVYSIDTSTLNTNSDLGMLPFTLPVGDLSDDGEVRITQALASTVNGTRAEPLGLLHGEVRVGSEGGMIESVALHDGFITFDYPSIPGNAYMIRSSTDLRDWIPLQTNVADGLSLTFTIVIDSTFQEQFFRVVEQP